MKIIKSIIAAFIILLVSAFVLSYFLPLKAQIGSQGTGTFTSGNQSPTVFTLLGSNTNYHQITWFVVGSLSACTLTLDTSANNSSWTTGGAIASQTCTGNGSATSTQVISNYVRINTNSSITGTGTLFVTYTGYNNNPLNSAITWPLTIPAGGGNVNQLTGPTDQPFQIASQNNQNIRVLPSGTGICQGCTDVQSVEKYVIQNSLTDIAVGINDACVNLPAQGGIIDARDVPMPMFWGSNPFGQGNNNCVGKGTIVFIVNAGAICYSAPLTTTTSRLQVYGAGAGTLSISTLQGTWLIPENTSGPYNNFCTGDPFGNYPQKLTAAIGGPFPTSWIGNNGTTTISTMTCTTGSCTVKASNTLPLNFCDATHCPPCTSSCTAPVNGATYVYVGGQSVGLCNGSYPITLLSTGTNTDDTFTYSPASGCTGVSTPGTTFVMAADAEAGIYDGQWPGAANTTQGQYCANNVFEHVWSNLVMVGNGIPSFTPYYNCGGQENSLAFNLVVGDSSLAQWVDDSTAFYFASGGGASHMHRHGVFPYLSSAGTSVGSQKCTVSNGGLTGTSNTPTLNDITTVTCATFTNAPTVLGWVYMEGNATGLTPGYYQVVGAGMGGCTANPTTTVFCINTPTQSSAACSSCSETAAYGPLGMVMEGYKPNTNQFTGGYEDCCWETTAGASATKQFWISKWINGTYGLIAIKEHGEQWYNAEWEVGEGNTIDRWLSSSSGDVTQAPNIQSIDAGGSNQPQGPGWGSNGTGVNLPSTIRLGPNVYNATLTSIMQIFGNSDIYSDIRNNTFVQSSGTIASEGEAIGQYSQGIQPVPACYSATGTCQAQSSGTAQIPTSGASVTISTTAVTANSNIQLQWVDGNTGGLTCTAPANLSSFGSPLVTGRTAGTSFTISSTTGTTPTTNPFCVHWSFQN